MYRGGRPDRLTRVINRATAAYHSSGVLSPRQAVTLEVRGRTSGRTITFPLVAADLDGERYLVSMLGEQVSWVRNVRAADGRAVLIRKGRQDVRLVEVPAADRAPILRRYLAIAPGARPHIPVDRRAPLEDFERAAPDFPVFRITTPDDPAAR